MYLMMITYAQQMNDSNGRRNEREKLAVLCYKVLGSTHEAI